MPSGMRTWSHAVRMTCLDVQAGIGSVARHLRELDRLGEDLDVLDRDIAQAAINDPAVKRLLTITGVNLIVAAGLIAAIGDVRRFPAPRSSSATSASTRGCRSPAWGLA